MGTENDDWAFKAATEIFNLFRDNSYFATRNSEHRKQTLDGWAEIIRRNAPDNHGETVHGIGCPCLFCKSKLMKAGNRV